MKKRVREYAGWIAAWQQQSLTAEEEGKFRTKTIVCFLNALGLAISKLD